MRCQPLLLVCLTALLTCACKVDLYTGLDQRQANEMLAVLMARSISCDKMPGPEDTWILRVEEQQLAPAMELLKARGYPRETFTSMGDMFPKEGLISSPGEERIRFIYALGQEMAATISQIDGVLAARVHIVLPENNPLGDNLTPSSASVFVKYQAGSGLDGKIPQIKQMVTNGIQGLSYDKVTVASFESRGEPASAPADRMVSILGLKVASSSATPLMALLSLLVIAALAAFGWHYRQHLSPWLAKGKQVVGNA